MDHLCPPSAHPGENQRVRLTKSLVKEALLTLLEAKPLLAVGVSELCRAVGINRSTFYAHYGNPRDVFDEIVDDMAAGMQSDLQTAAEHAPLTLEQHVEVACTYLRAHERTAKIVFSAANDIPGFVETLGTLPADRAHTLTQMLADCDKSTRNLLTTCLVYGFYHLIRKWLLDDVDKTPAEMGALVQRVGFAGLIYPTA